MPPRYIKWDHMNTFVSPEYFNIEMLQNFRCHFFIKDTKEVIMFDVYKCGFSMRQYWGYTTFFFFVH